MDSHDQAASANIKTKPVPNTGGLPARSEEGIWRVTTKQIWPQLEKVTARANVEKDYHQEARDVEERRHGLFPSLFPTNPWERFQR